MYTDIHTHILYGTDDGPKTQNDMFSMLELAYRDGVRCMCVTPHFNFSFYGDNTQQAKKAYEDLVRHAKEKFPDMHFCLGNEIFYHHGCTAYLKEGVCRSLNKSKYVLVDFPSSQSKFNILSAMKNILGHGYIPIIAHAERYTSLGISVSFIEKLREFGVIIQINAGSITGKNSLRERFFSRRILKKNLCDIIASDSHNLTDRATCMTQAAEYIRLKHGKQAVGLLMQINPSKILNNQRI